MKGFINFFKPLIFSALMSFILFVFLFFINIKFFYLNIFLGIISYFLLIVIFRRNVDDSTKLRNTIELIVPLIFSFFLALISQSFFSTLPNLVIAPSIGLISGFFFDKGKGLIRIFSLILPIVIIIWSYKYGSLLWQHYLIYKNFDNGIVDKELPKFSYNNDINFISDSTIKGKPTIILFWNNCKYSYRHLRVLKELSSDNKYKNINIYTVFIPSQIDSAIHSDFMPIDLGIEKPSFNAKDPNLFTQQFGNLIIPSAIYIDSNNRIRFEGDINMLDFDKIK